MVQAGKAWGVDPPGNKVHVEQEAGPVGFNKDRVQVAPEISRGTAPEEGGEGRQLAGDGHSARAEEFHFPFPLQLFPLR